ncbi:MAG: DUF3429 domain-containing protein [Halioglobus sp.]
MAVNHEKIRRLLGEKEAATDNSLRAKSLGRALTGEVPKTLTPYEWQQWYAERGVPDSHLAPQVTKHSESWWRHLGNTHTSDTDKTPLYATWLGRVGLLPFVGLLAALYLDAQHQQLWAKSLATYTLAIICFLVGAWWGLALIRRSPAALLMSNAVVLVAVFGHVLLAPAPFFLLGALLFLATVVIERRHALFHRQPSYYARLRLQLSLVASASLLLAAIHP